MIQESCAPSPAREETGEKIPPSCSNYQYINLSVVYVEEKILKYLLDHKGWISTTKLFDHLNLDIQGMDSAARGIHNLGRRGIIEIKANAVRAARGLKKVVK